MYVSLIEFYWQCFDNCLGRKKIFNIRIYKNQLQIDYFIIGLSGLALGTSYDVGLKIIMNIWLNLVDFPHISLDTCEIHYLVTFDASYMVFLTLNSKLKWCPLTGVCTEFCIILIWVLPLFPVFRSSKSKFSRIWPLLLFGVVGTVKVVLPYTIG